MGCNNSKKATEQTSRGAPGKLAKSVEEPQIDLKIAVKPVTVKSTKVEVPKKEEPKIELKPEPVKQYPVITEVVLIEPQVISLPEIHYLKQNPILNDIILIEPAEIQIPQNILENKNPVIEQVICQEPCLPNIPTEIFTEYIEPEEIQVAVSNDYDEESQYFFDENDYDSGDEKEKEKFQQIIFNQLISPLTEDEIQRFTEEEHQPIEDSEHFPYHRQDCQQMDKMGGLYIPATCRDQFLYLRVKRQWRYIIFQLNSEDLEFVEIQRCGPRKMDFQDLVSHLPDDSARWIIFDFEIQIEDRGAMINKEKIVFIVYNPDTNENNQEKKTINFKKKFLQERVVKHTGIDPKFVELTIRDKAELDYDQILKKVFN